MEHGFNRVKAFLHEMGIAITSEDTAEELVIVDDEENGIRNLVIDCEAPIVVLEQPILQNPSNPDALFERLLVLNRELVHGAFAYEPETRTILFRDTLQLENLDLNELEASIRALTLALVEFGSELLEYK